MNLLLAAKRELLELDSTARKMDSSVAWSII